MATASATFLDIALDTPDDEEALYAWWRSVAALLVARFRATRTDLYALERGRYVAVVETRLPGVWPLVLRSSGWRKHEQDRPPARIEVRHSRLWHGEGNPRDVSTSELVRLLAERDRGERTLVLLDTLPAASFARRHLPGAVNLPLAALDEEGARRVLGTDRERTVVVYCSGYT